jgi:hypothetical protein
MMWLVKNLIPLIVHILCSIIEAFQMKKIEKKIIRKTVLQSILFPPLLVFSMSSEKIPFFLWHHISSSLLISSLLTLSFRIFYLNFFEEILNVNYEKFGNYFFKFGIFIDGFTIICAFFIFVFSSKKKKKFQSQMERQELEKNNGDLDELKENSEKLLSAKDYLTFNSQKNENSFQQMRQQDDHVETQENETWKQFSNSLGLLEDDYLSQNYEEKPIDESLQDLNLFESDPRETNFLQFRDVSSTDLEEESYSVLTKIYDILMKNNLKYTKHLESLITISIPKNPILGFQTSFNTYMNPLLTHHQFVNVEADGNCFYRAISYNLFKTEKFHIWMRILTLLEFIKNQQFYLQFLERLQIDPLEILKSTYTTGHKGWATDVHIYILSNALERKIFLLDGENQLQSHHQFVFIPLTVKYPSLCVHWYSSSHNHFATILSTYQKEMDLKVPTYESKIIQKIK